MKVDVRIINIRSFNAKPKQAKAKANMGSLNFWENSQKKAKHQEKSNEKKIKEIPFLSSILLGVTK